MARKTPARKAVDPASLPYRPCVGVMVLNAEGKVFCGRRIQQVDDETLGSDKLWQMPQGGIDPGEEPYAAALRELYEETGMRSVLRLAEAPHWIHYDLPPTLVGVSFKGKYRGQTQKWFALRFDGDEAEIRINPPPGGHAAEFDAWAWKPVDSLPDIVVPFKRKVYAEIIAMFRPVADQVAAQASGRPGAAID